MTNAIHALEYKYYTSRPGWQNGTLEYHEFLAGYIPSPDASVLEIGPGPHSPSTEFVKSIVGKLDGLDIDERVLNNPGLENAMTYDGREFPIPDECYDLVVADYVMEHVEDPTLMLREIGRVLKPGGHFVFRTPNIYHYVSIISRFTPHSFHLAVANQARQNPEDSIEPYPTFYRFNSRSAVSKIIEQSSLSEAELRLIEKQPSYLQFYSWTYQLGVAYERMVNSTNLLAGLRSNILGALVKS